MMYGESVITRCLASSYDLLWSFIGPMNADHWFCAQLRVALGPPTTGPH